jgi:prepilin-type N-terminal cleavage/methylation domain-containing protein
MKITPNLEPRTPNAECPVRPAHSAHSMLGVECSMFDVSRSVPDRFPLAARRAVRHFFKSAIGNRQSAIAFTLVELLVVISIMGILAALTVPALKNMGKSNIQISATRQLLEDIGHARQLAISRHATVYMVFVTTNFFNLNNYNNENIVVGLNNNANFSSTSDQQAALKALTNVVDKQLTGYNFISLGRVGDQPGQHAWHYLDDWKSLPDGTFIAAGKFLPQSYSLAIPGWQANYASQIDYSWKSPAGYQVNQVSGFAQWQIPFPTEKSPLVAMPCIAFDQTGRLISEADASGTYHHAYIPLAQGSVSYGIDANKHPTLAPVLPDRITEIPPGNSGIGNNNLSYNVIDIDPLTGRARQQQYKMQ